MTNYFSTSGSRRLLLPGDMLISARPAELTPVCIPTRQRDPSSAGLCVCRSGDTKRKLDPESRKMRAGRGPEERPGRAPRNLEDMLAQSGQIQATGASTFLSDVGRSLGAGGGPWGPTSHGGRVGRVLPAYSVSAHLASSTFCQGPHCTAGPAPCPCPHLPGLSSGVSPSLD